MKTRSWSLFAKAHLPGALKLSQEMSWPYRIEDWAFALKVGQGFVLERAGEVIGTAAWFPYGDTHATVGMIIVRRLRGADSGGGWSTRYSMRRRANHLLNSTAKAGRCTSAAASSHRYHPPVSGHSQGRHETPPPDVGRAMEPSEFDAVARLDGQATGEWGPLLRRLLQRRGAGSSSRRRAGRLRDCPALWPGIRRRARGRGRGLRGARVSSRRRSRAWGCFVRVDTAAIPELSPWLEEIGLSQVSDALTMVRGTLPPTGPARVFALSNQSFN